MVVPETLLDVSCPMPLITRLPALPSACTVDTIIVQLDAWYLTVYPLATNSAVSTCSPLPVMVTGTAGTEGVETVLNYPGATPTVPW